MKRISRDVKVVDRPEINKDRVASVYSGRAGRCCCGCSGKHSYSSAHTAWSGRYRGYSITEGEISDRAVKLITGKIAKADGVKVYGEPNRIFSVEIGNRIYIAYMKA